MIRNNFNLGHTKLASMNQGALVPLGLVEVLPGDSFRHSLSALVRTQPLLAPVMHPVNVRIHHWFVPSRILWDEFEQFITGGPDNDFDGQYPVIQSPPTTGFAVGSLADYLGVPPGVPNLQVNALPFRAYAKIFNEWYRDQDLTTELVIDETGGLDTTTSTALKNCCWEKDYFTSARPTPQKGDAITIPLTGDAPVVMNNASTNPLLTRNANTNALAPTQILASNASSQLCNNSGTPLLTLDPNGRWVADMDNVQAVSINALRLASALQTFGENRNRFGSRYVEYLRAMGVKSSDARLQLPEYLGGGKQTIQFSEVLATTNNDDTELGQLGGHGIAAMRSNSYLKYFEEHGYVISVMSVLPKTIYAQGLPRTWNRRVNMDYWQPELEHIGQQAVLNKEVKASHATPDGVFGYQDRYDEYRRMESSIAGEFRDTLDFWHMARIFDTDPALNDSFVTANPTNRIYAATNASQLYVMASHRLHAKRKLAKVGTSFLR